MVIGAGARWFDGVSDALTAEALAVREGLELAVELGLERVELEIDCQGLAALLKEPSSTRSCIGGLCFDIAELSKSFSGFRIKWVPRDSNVVAHFCAATVSATDRCYFWLDSIPAWLAELAAKDCNHDMNQ
jgi:hypothetical protein